MKASDIEKAYSFCKGTLSDEERQEVIKRRKKDSEFNSLIAEIRDLFKTTNSANVDRIVNSWKITRIEYADIRDENKEQVTENSASESSDEKVEKLIREHDKNKRLQKVYLIVTVVFIILIVVLLLILL